MTLKYDNVTTFSKLFNPNSWECGMNIDDKTEIHLERNKIYIDRINGTHSLNDTKKNVTTDVERQNIKSYFIPQKK